MKINLMVVDLSHHESVQSYTIAKSNGIEGVIWKATQGSGYHDNTYHSNREKAKAAGLLWGSYHFGDASTVTEQIQNYVDYAKVGEDELFCLDLEDNHASQMTLEKARIWMEGVELALGRIGQCVVYSGNTLKEMLGERVDPFWGTRRLWLAQYGVEPRPQKSWAKDGAWLWQYTDGEVGPHPHAVPGINNGHGIDCNSFAGSAEDLKSSWSGHSSSAPVPGIPPLPVPPAAKPVVTVSIHVPEGVDVKVEML